jgi:branched-chain amino acid transport system ATP-binding protein
MSELRLEDVHTFYGESHVLQGVNMRVAAGATVALLGRNGMGKTTTIRSIMGMTPPRRGRIQFGDRDLAGLPPRKIAHAGIALVPQGRRVFASLTVDENLRVVAREASGADAWTVARVYELFPRLQERRMNLAGTLSGGEQQMLALARALVGRPRLLMLDEPSLGLAPTIVRELFATVKRLNEEDGLTVLVVEQNATIALDVAARAYVLEVGKVAVAGMSDELKRHEGVRKSYLGY